jgi:glycosyltransferase involved in cell wall biosynthesis
MPQVCEPAPYIERRPRDARAARDGSRLHVLTLTPFYPSAGDDATGCFIAEPLLWLESFGVKNSVIAARPIYRQPVRPASAAPAEWVSYIAAPSWPGLASSGSFLFSRISSQIRRLHASHPISLIHAHAALPCGHAAALLSRELGIPFIVSVHGRDAYFSRQVRSLARGWCRRVSAGVYRAAARVICVSQIVRDEVKAGAPSASCSVIYNGVDTGLFYPSPVAERMSTVLSIGNLIPSKGHEFLLRAVASIRSVTRFRCEIIGTGPEQRRLARLADELGIAITFLGHQSRQSVADALRSCTIFALPSRYEGLGCVFLEAMATARPLIAGMGQGIGELIKNGQNGFLVDGENSNDIAQALLTLLNDADLRARMGTAARSTVLNDFTLVHQADRLAQLYQECTQ